VAKDLFDIWKACCYCTLNGCSGPHFFTPMVAGFILDIPQEPNLTEVPDECEFLTQLTNISECNDEASFISAAVLSILFLNALIRVTQKQL